MADMYSGLTPQENSLLKALLAGEQRTPTEQPVEAVPAEPDTSGIVGWDPSMIVTSPFSVLADPGPAYDPNMVYRFDTGNKIGIPNASGGYDYQNAAPVVFQPGQQYVMVNPLNGNVIARASTPEEMQKLVDLSSSNKDWQLYRANEQGGYTPGTQLFDRSNAGSLGSLLVNMGAIALPAVGGAVLGPALAGTGALGIGVSAPVGVGLGTAAGSALSGATAGKSIEDILKQAAIAGITAGGFQALAGSSSATANKVAGLAADLQPQVIDGTITAAQAAQQLTRAGATAADIARFTADVAGTAVSTAPTVIGNIANAVAGAAPVASGASGAIGAATSVPGTVVQGRPDPADIIRANPQIGILDPLLSQFTQDEIINASRRVQQEQNQPATTVTATQPTVPTPPPSILPPPATTVTASTTPASVEQTAPPVVVPPPGTTVVGDTTRPQLTENDIRTLPGNPTLAPNTSEFTLDKNGNLLNDILKYYTLGSGVLDMLGVGQGGGGTTATTPYTSTLGVLPTLGRGAFTPYQGDYEQYGFGPEFNFFGGAKNG